MSSLDGRRGAIAAQIEKTVPRPHPPNLIFGSIAHAYKDTAILPMPTFRSPLEPRGLSSDSWVEVTHCPVGERGGLWFYRLPGSGLWMWTAAWDKTDLDL